MVENLVNSPLQFAAAKKNPAPGWVDFLVAKYLALVPLIPLNHACSVEAGICGCRGMSCSQTVGFMRLLVWRGFLVNQRLPVDFDLLERHGFPCVIALI